MKNNSFNQTARFRLVGGGKGRGEAGGWGEVSRERHAKGGRELARPRFHCTMLALLDS